MVNKKLIEGLDHKNLSMTTEKISDHREHRYKLVDEKHTYELVDEPKHHATKFLQLKNLQRNHRLQNNRST